MSNARIFFAGVGTTILLIGAGFGGGLMLAHTAMEPAPQVRTNAADQLPPARVVLPVSSEPAPPPPSEAAAVPAPLPQQAQPRAVFTTEAAAQSEKENEQADRAERRKTEAAERHQRRRAAAERKARREAARLAKQRQEQQQETYSTERPPIMAFGGESRTAGFFGN